MNIPSLYAKCTLSQAKFFKKYPNSKKYSWTKKKKKGVLNVERKLDKRGNNSREIKNFY